MENQAAGILVNQVTPEFSMIPTDKITYFIKATTIKVKLGIFPSLKSVGKTAARLSSKALTKRSI
jgi:hypothetical protein